MKKALFRQQYAEEDGIKVISTPVGDMTEEEFNEGYNELKNMIEEANKEIKKEEEKKRGRKRHI